MVNGKELVTIVIAAMNKLAKVYISQCNTS